MSRLITQKQTNIDLSNLKSQSSPTIDQLLAKEQKQNGRISGVEFITEDIREEFRQILEQIANLAIDFDLSIETQCLFATYFTKYLQSKLTINDKQDLKMIRLDALLCLRLAMKYNEDQKYHRSAK